MATENKGVIYYKLDPDYHFDGDFTKNCGLTGGEIDSNFQFLRGYDISTIDVTPDKTELIITRLNGEEARINIAKELNVSDFKYEFEYDKNEGILKIITPYEETINLEGFLTDKFNRVFGDFSILGDGSRYNPLKISNNAKTGTYRPVKTIIDLTTDSNSLPSENIARNDRYLTKEKISRLGLLYPLSGVDAIKARLEEIGSEWRIPTKEDWDQLLNIVEECPEDKTHEGDLTNVYLGVNAGAYLKSTSQWEPYYKKLEDGEVVIDGERYTKDENGEYIADEHGEYQKIFNSEDKFDFSIYPVGFGERRGIDSIGGYGKWAGYWTSTEEDKNRDMYVKVFSYDTRSVEQNTWGNGCYLSLRLVKDYTGDNLYDIEDIDGVNVSTIHFTADNDIDRERYNTTLIWTKENIAFSNSQYGGVTSPEWHENNGESFFIRYYINDWNGERWVKNEMQEGDSVVIIDADGIKMHEWRVIGGELVDSLNDVINEIDKLNTKLDDTNLAITIEAENRAAADNELQKQINGNKVVAADSGIEIVNGYTIDNITTPTTIKVKLAKNSMLRFDEDGFYFDGDFNIDGDNEI